MRRLFFAPTAFFIAVLLIAPVSAITGASEIYVDSNVYGASVYIDGSYRGTTPGYFDVPLTDYAYSVEVSEIGYYTYSTYADAGDSVYASLNPNYDPIDPIQPVPVPTRSAFPAIALIAGLGATVFFALRRE